jgi:class 3 adenylate cyclase/predicted ATPase
MWSAAMDVGGWLRSLGLDRYEQSFRDNRIDADVLPHLTADDLRDVGVSAVGDRRRILAAIGALAAGAPRPDLSAPKPSAAPRTKAADIAAERRPITVMFCDLVGSTSIAARMDAEDWRNLVGAYLDAASEVVTGLGGHMPKRLGDGLMALFGYPAAQENDAERAVRAALAIHLALAELNTRTDWSSAPKLSARIGVATGTVVVDATGEVFGEAPNVAARVQAAAEPGTVLVTGAVQRQTAGLFVVEDRGAHELRGMPVPIALFRIVRASGGGRRGSGRIPTPLIGREEELRLLERPWSRVLGGAGQFVQIVGEPGIGKSRLLEAFRERLAGAPHTWIEWTTSQLLQNTPLHPIVEWGRQRFGGSEVPAERRLADLEGALAQVRLDPAEQAPLIAPLVEIPLPPERALALPPDELRRRQLTAMTALHLAGAHSQPVVLAVEDLHWADPTTLDLVGSLAERGSEAPMLIVATARPEFRAPWPTRSHHHGIFLAPLDRADVRRMTGEIAAGQTLSEHVIDTVAERTGGVPLFVEEVTRLLLERGDEGGQTIPPTLQQSLAARLDRLGDAREVAQIGAALGREFGYPLLRDVAGIGDPALQAALDRLTEADILLVDGVAPQATYRFKHALIQDAAYESLLRSRRRTLHRRAAELLRDSPGKRTIAPEEIAYHFDKAGLDDLAIEWWGMAGDQALRRSAFQEAIAHLGKAIELADRTASGPSVSVPRERRQLHVAYGNALFAARGPGAPETEQAFARARNSQVGDNAALDRLAAVYGLWVGSYVRGELSAMREHSTAFLNDVEAKPESPEASVGHRIAGITHWLAGEHREAKHHLKRALALFQPGRDDDLAFRFVHDAGVAAMVCLALTLWPLGEIDGAVSLVKDAEARSASLAHIATRAHAQQHAALFELMRGDLSRVAPNALELARLVRDHDLPHWRAYAVFLEGLARTESGSRDGLYEMRHGAELLRERIAHSFDGLITIALAEAEAGSGEVDRAVAILDEALMTCERTGRRAFEAELHRVRGEMLLRCGSANSAHAEDALHAAVAVARKQETRSFELRAALALAKLCHSTGRPADAHAVLAPALDGFAPTPEMPEVAEAQALLAKLAESEEVVKAAASRLRRLQLEASLGQATMYSRGYASDESKSAFTRARTLAEGAGDAGARFDAYYGLFIGSMLRGEFRVARQTGERFLRDAENERRTAETAVARRSLGFAHLVQGDLTGAEANLAEALGRYLPERDGDSRFRFGADIGASAAGHLALASWMMGDLERARALGEEALARADETAHAPTRVTAYQLVSLRHMLRGDARAVRRIADDLVELAREHGMALYLAFGDVHLKWALAWLDDRKSGTTGLGEALAVYLGQGNRLYAPLYQGLLAELEAEGDDREGALRRTEQALALASESDGRWTDAMLHRIRGKILLSRERANPAPAEAAFLEAVAVAQAQGARSLELQAALPLVKLYRSTGRIVEAHTTLSDALVGFAPTSEMPEIAEAQTLIEQLA